MMFILLSHFREVGIAPTSVPPIRTLLHRASEIGSAAFNRGHHGACLQEFQRCLTTIVDSSMLADATLREDVAATMKEAGTQSSLQAAAWLMRDVMEALYNSETVSVVPKRPPRSVRLLFIIRHVSFLFRCCLDQI